MKRNAMMVLCTRPLIGKIVRTHVDKRPVDQAARSTSGRKGQPRSTETIDKGGILLTTALPEPASSSSSQFRLTALADQILDRRTMRHFIHFIALAAMAILRASDAGETAAPGQKETGALPPVDGQKRALILCGHPGDEEHKQPFADAVTKLRQGLMTAVGIPGENISIYFGVDPETDDKSLLNVPNSGPATREAISKAAESLRSELRPQDTLWVIVMGHGHYDGRRSWLNLPGPDMHQDEFGRLFKEITCREQVFVIATAASGYYLKPLAAPGRAVISATDADLEINETLFADALADRLNPPSDAPLDDADGDETISLFDLYIATVRKVHQLYVTETLLSTEHALLDDNGDGRGTEVQQDYLTEEEGGRRRKGAAPRRPAGKDGALAVSIKLLLKPAPPTDEPAGGSAPADPPK